MSCGGPNHSVVNVGITVSPNAIDPDAVDPSADELTANLYIDFVVSL